MGPGLRPPSLVTLAVLLSGVLVAGRGLAATTTCTGGAITSGDASTDLQVTGPCTVAAGTYIFHNVNIYAKDPSTCTANPSSCGSLTFADDPSGIDFYAENIIVENGGSLTAGTTAPIGTTCSGGKCGTVTIHLWGAATEPGALCKSGTDCGVPNSDPNNIWGSNTYNTDFKNPPATCKAMTLPGGVNDCFYPYEPLDPADQKNNIPAYFGHKVLAVSYGGTLQLFGRKGAIYPADASPPCKESDPPCSGTSWARLKGSLKPGVDSMTIDKAVDWQDKDHIVITTTDYLPGHSEELIINGTPKVDTTAGTTTFNFTNADGVTTGVKWAHNGKSIDLTDTTYPGISRLGLNITQADTQAAVGLLTRSIRIVSDGDKPMSGFPAAPTDGSVGYFFGGHTIVRQGFQTYQVQGVEFYQLGQGGAIMHYPVHFHMDRKTPQVSGQPAAYVKDSSIWDSMTRWIVIHGTQDVLLARNIGYKSIGHGYYLEDGTETGNRLYSNLGVFARAAIANAQNPRRVPGILTTKDPACDGTFTTLPSNKCFLGYDSVPFYSDANHPAVFWIMNGMNDFEYNFAAGAGTCGVCYWLVPGAVSGPSRLEKWFGYASEQLGVKPNAEHPDQGFDERAGTTPLQTFIGNTCTTAMTSFQEVGNSSVCNGVNLITSGVKPDTTLLMLPSSQATENFPPKRATDTYWPIVGGGGRQATRCKNADEPSNAYADCSASGNVALCASGNQANCDVTVVDRYTTSFNWAQKNFSAIWMRPFWSLVIDSVITDPQAAGINFVTSGDYSKSSVPDGFWALARKSAFIGSTQWKNPQSDLQNDPYSSSAGPFNPFTDGTAKGLSCVPDPISGGLNFLYCLSMDAGISMQLETFTNFQRMFSVYDGPVYQDSNAYLNIQPTYLTNDGTVTGTARPGCTPNACPESAKDCNPCAAAGFKDGGLFGVRADQLNNRCYLPNAAIGWKQSNGFYYAPAFHSTNLYFNGVKIRHFVTEPLFVPELLGFKTDLKAAREEYCRYQDNMFNNFTDIDRETVLNDDDGTLTGLTSPVNQPKVPKTETISVNKEAFFDAPVETPECASDLPLNAKADAKCPPNTAKTSPYEYVSTVVFPECGLSAPPPTKEVPLAQCKDKKGNQTWGSACSSSPLGDPILGCAGVPIYRQLITSTEKEGLAQVKRMMGQNDFQRSGLTVNNGVYYIDTTLSRAKQEKDAKATSLNVFTADQKYDLYFLYANKDTKQTYQMFVGKDLPGCPSSPTFAASNVKFGYVDITTNAYTFALARPSGTSNKDKKAGDLPVGWTSNYDCKTGILTLGVDMTSLADDFDLTKDTMNRKPPVALGQERCQPATMCTWSTTDSQCECKKSNKYFNLCSQQNPSGETVCSWAVKDIDCPARGCPSFQITFPEAKYFEAKDQDARPKPSVFNFANTGPSISFNWNVGFNLEDSSTSGPDCHYGQQPPLTCPAPPTAIHKHKKRHRKRRASSTNGGFMRLGVVTGR
jgi:cell migration-inducing and hyaluronan-binding protein